MDKSANLPPKTEYKDVDDINSKDSSSLGTKPVSDSDPGLLGRIALSATQLAGSISQGKSTFGSDALAEAKLGRREGSASTSQSHATEGIQAQAIYAQRRPELASTVGGAASAFRQHLRATTGREEQAHTTGDNRPSHETVIDYKGKGTSTEYHDRQLLLHGGSHQVGLAQNLDGQDVAKLLSQTMPASMSIMPTDAAAAYEQHQPQLTHQGQSQPGAIDPVAYLQSASYAVDMELFDHQVPQSARGTTNGHTLSASPGGASRGWDEHGASVLEEWQLNEAWDRAWMDTAWGSAHKKDPVEPKADPVLPSHKNLSYLLKPRI
ncbi:hypothetical protein GGH94_001064 [Coemansia aciculifera]|uniref:Uncharacterized protein n=1 Tax=Coemansia aciculifera TaxID=417176 RepID=A0A9W8ITA0_9FUNG|nr:hypothetical protein GGH94_001064 [Coemansia aciculifera]